MGKTGWTPLQAEIIRLDKLLVKTMYPECEIDDVNIAFRHG